ncbi:hypothetical protein Z043_106723 [Scleropages formosus]|uniref:Uncharacterized protein n=1 Tax=Scleropages formosus TaxID=113540 RepID=A0A0P7XCR7_SCLFO|nr:hypothetical protein Z043_106723 [Scleropages formosus]
MKRKEDVSGGGADEAERLSASECPTGPGTAHRDTPSTLPTSRGFQKQADGDEKCQNEKKSRHNSPGRVRYRKAGLERRMTCPSPREISRALLTPTQGFLTRAANLDDLIQRCLLCFGECTAYGRGIAHVSNVHISLWAARWTPLFCSSFTPLLTVQTASHESAKPVQGNHAAEA